MENLPLSEQLPLQTVQLVHFKKCIINSLTNSSVYDYNFLLPKINFK